jgi:uncharacterized glyoxalase superfamily metalloenzyme YdcJ
VNTIQKYSVLKIKRIAVKQMSPDLNYYLSKISEKPETNNQPKINKTHYGPSFDVLSTKYSPRIRAQKTAETKRRLKKVSPSPRPSSSPLHDSQQSIIKQI